MPGNDLNLSAGRRELRGVVQEIGEDLRQPRAIGVQMHGTLGQRDVELMAGRIDRRPAGFDCVVEDRSEIHVLVAELNFVARDAANIEQVVNQPSQLLHLPPEYAGRFRSQGAVAGIAVEQFQGVSNRRERIAQLVRKRCKNSLSWRSRFARAFSTSCRCSISASNEWAFCCNRLIARRRLSSLSMPA